MNISITNTLSWFPLLVQAMYTDSCCWHSRNCPLYYIKSPTAQRMSAWALTWCLQWSLVWLMSPIGTLHAPYTSCVFIMNVHISTIRTTCGATWIQLSLSLCASLYHNLCIYSGIVQLRKLRLSNACFWLIQQIKNLTNQCTLCFENTDAIAKYDNKNGINFKTQNITELTKLDDNIYKNHGFACYYLTIFSQCLNQINTKTTMLLKRPSETAKLSKKTLIQ